LTKRHEVSGYGDFLKIAEIMDEFVIVDFEVSDIVRSTFIYNYIVSKMRVECGYSYVIDKSKKV
jgi:hypothetical protein